MRINDALTSLLEWDRKGRYVYAKRDLAKLFDDPSENTLSQSLKRLVNKKILIRASRDVYVFSQSSHIGATTLEEIAATLHRGEYVFVSLESALSEWGRISQIPINRITLMTTGRRGEHRTPFGTIEFTHTARNAKEIHANTIFRPGHPLPIATEAFALQNLKDTRRNLNMLTNKD